MKQSDASSFRGNRKRLKERDSGRPFPWNNKKSHFDRKRICVKEKPDRAVTLEQGTNWRPALEKKKKNSSEPAVMKRGNKIMGRYLGSCWTLCFCERRSRMREFRFGCLLKNTRDTKDTSRQSSSCRSVRARLVSSHCGPRRAWVGSPLLLNHEFDPLSALKLAFSYLFFYQA